MVSRDTTVHAAVVIVSIAAVVAINWAYPDLESSALTFVLLGFYGLILAGAHLFLAWLGEDGVVPVSSRWRFVSLVVVGLGLLAIVLLTDPIAVGSLNSDVILTALAVLAVLGYWVLEASEGYRERSS